MNIIQSDRFWIDLGEIVKVFEPCLFILRLTDRESPAMDQLYFYVRKMDELVNTLKNTLNLAEDKYNRQPGPNLDSKIINYLLRSKDNEDLKKLITSYDEKDLQGEDDDSSIEDEGPLNDDMESDEETVDDSITESDERCGTILENAWVRRSKALRTDVAIAGWMCSPHPEIMSDCKSNHNGEHKMAVTNLLRKWFGHKVSIA